MSTSGECGERPSLAVRTLRFKVRADLCNLSAGATEFFDHIGADTIQRIATEFATRRMQFKKARLRWRKSSGSHRSLGWIPFKAASIRRRGRYLRFCGKTIRIFESDRFARIEKWQCGCFSQDAVGDWYLCLPVAVADETPAPTLAEVERGCLRQSTGTRFRSVTRRRVGHLARARHG